MDAAIPHLEDRVATSISSRKESDTIFHPNYLLFKDKDNRQFCTCEKTRNIPQEFLAPFSFKEIVDEVVQRKLFQRGNEWRAMTCNYSEVR